MANPSITIPLDPQTARAYDSAAPEEKRKIQALLSLWVRELAAGCRTKAPSHHLLAALGTSAAAVIAIGRWEARREGT